MRPALTPAAAGLLRGLIARAGVNKQRILLSDFRTIDWQSLTFIGERHEIRLRLPAPDAADVAEKLTSGLADAEWRIGGQIVADVALDGPMVHHRDGSISLSFEALTIAE